VHRAAEKRLEADTLQMQIEVDGRRSRESAQAEAAELVANARDTAHAIVTEAEQRTSQLVRDAEDRLAALREERDGVAHYFESLRGALTGAQRVDVES
jgi:cell division septum initiation protein DivIVA